MIPTRKDPRHEERRGPDNSLETIPVNQIMAETDDSASGGILDFELPEMEGGSEESLDELCVGDLGGFPAVEELDVWWGRIRKARKGEVDVTWVPGLAKKNS